MKVSSLGGMKLKMSRPYTIDQDWSREIQLLAIQQIYPKVWPDCQILELDDDRLNLLKQTLDVGGADKLLRYSDKTVAFLAQRFRTYEESLEYDDFTLRFTRPYSKATTECEKVLRSLAQNRLLASFYSYGHVNKEKNGFLRFRILKFKEFLEAWRDRKIPPPIGPIPNPDGTTFLAWSFAKIPKELIFWELKSKKNLTDFLEGDLNG